MSVNGNEVKYKISTTMGFLNQFIVKINSKKKNKIKKKNKYTIKIQNKIRNQ
jgi:hypothetical protein